MTQLTLFGFGDIEEPCLLDGFDKRSIAQADKFLDRKDSTEGYLSGVFGSVCTQPYVDLDWTMSTIRWDSRVIYGYKERDLDVGTFKIVGHDFELLDYRDSLFLTLKKPNGKRVFLLPAIDRDSALRLFYRLDRRLDNPFTRSMTILDGFHQYAWKDVISEKPTGGVIHLKNGSNDKLYLEEELFVKSHSSRVGDFTLYLADSLEAGVATYDVYASYNKLSTGFWVCRIDPHTVPLKYRISPVAESLPVGMGDVEQQAKAVRKVSITKSSLPDGVVEELKLLTIEGNAIVLPTQQLVHYAKIRQVLIKAGGKYSRGKFIISGKTPSEVLSGLLGGVVVKSKAKEMAFFATKDEAARRVVDAVRVRLDLDSSSLILEPSAGHGAIADVVRSLGLPVITNEIWEDNRRILEAKGYHPYAFDFLDTSLGSFGVDRPMTAIMLNPPWGKFVELQHVYHAYSLLDESGVLSALIAPSYLTSLTAKAKAFREWLKSVDADESEVSSGSFEGTSVSGVHLVITK
ncbi:hypothetical protein A6E01_20595 (plasmid) [Vibrio breoganii]|uniref:Uncharacterized protein n=1 Tax=Vibrio breoganii TaxID=553239 RepID=A0AAN1CUE0_9VIBR|nr:SAM-dependent methyltransferase [Vibrio breoganii]ANO35613.1 hypothetical protein A6E01_20595 [Vibrio breoganii]